MNARTAMTLGCLMISAGCATTPKPREVYLNDPAFLHDNLSRTFHAPRDTCFTATMNALKELKIDVTKSDAQAGTIVTDRTPFYHTTTMRMQHSEYASTGRTESIDQQHKYHLEVVGDPKECTVRATRYQLWTNNIEAVSTTSNVDWPRTNVWGPFFDTIGEQLAEK